MAIDLSKLTLTTELETEPRAIFNSLVNKSKKYNGYLRDVQSEVLDQWFEMRDKKDNLIKMNTGSGKTVVALLILQSCLNETKGKCVYVVPDNYLIEQVKKEAIDLGVTVVTNEEDIDFLRGQAILLISIYKLINGKSRFGLSSGKNIDINAVLIDDVHSCLEIAEQQATLTIERSSNEDVYNKFLKLFANSLKHQNSMNLKKIISGDYASSPMLVPFWEWQSKKENVETILLNQKDQNEVMFKLPLLEGILHLCHCTISCNRIQISPKCLPIEKISKFQNANRRIYLSATLSDDGVLVTNFNVNKNDIEKIITPKKAVDIGDRMILYPQAITPTIKDEEIRDKLKILSKDYRIIVIVPSRQRVSFWESVADHIFDGSNLTLIGDYEKGLDIVINRYEGIDLPDNKCRILVIDGLPMGKTDYSIVKENYLDNSESIVRSKIQKIEQGMGRGVRSNEDYCGVILMSKELIHTMYNANGISYFSPATFSQYTLSDELSSQLRGKSIDEIMETLNYCLLRDSYWVGIGKKSLNSVNSDDRVYISEEKILFRKAFNFAISSNYDEAVNVFNNIISDDNRYIGWLEQEKAEYLNLIKQDQAQALLISATRKNICLLKPITGIRRRINHPAIINQIENISNYIKKYQNDMNNFLINVEAILGRLVFIPSEVNQKAFENFESGILQLGELLGFASERPEKIWGDGGPDNLWFIGDGNVMIIECKSGCTVTEISKDDCSQLLSSTQWFINQYCLGDKTYNPISIIIHPSYKFAHDASPNPDFLIIGRSELEILVENTRKFSQELSRTNFSADNISNLLMTYKLSYKNIVQEYTRKFRN